MLQFDVVTLFPQMLDAVTEWGVTGRARERGLYQLVAWNPRDFTSNAYRTVDDRPYGGGPGMVMMAEPLALAFHHQHIVRARPHDPGDAPQLVACGVHYGEADEIGPVPVVHARLRKVIPRDGDVLPAQRGCGVAIVAAFEFRNDHRPLRLRTRYPVRFPFRAASQPPSAIGGETFSGLGIRLDPHPA